MTDSPEKSSVNTLEAAVEYVRDMVAMFRRRGAKTEFAIPDVAEILELTPKRAKSLFYKDGVWAVGKVEADRIQNRFISYLDKEIALSIEYTETLRLKKLQLSLGLECKKQNSQRHGSGFESTASLWRSAG